MDLNFFENDNFCQIFNINLNKIVWRNFLKFLEYSKKISKKTVIKVVKKQMGVVRVIPFTLCNTCDNILNFLKESHCFMLLSLIHENMPNYILTKT